MKTLFKGPIAALLTPRTSEGSVDYEALARLLDFLYTRDITGVVVAGGTGDYASLSTRERKELTVRAVELNDGRGSVIVCNGAARIEQSVEIGEHALEAGADAMLLPPPHFYRYEQQDLEAFYHDAAERLGGPILIYNLAGFVTPIEPETIVRIIENEAAIVGVKDSSGSLEALRMLKARDDLESVRVLGNDTVLAEALEEKLIDAVISGPAGVIPEATVRMFEAAESTGEVWAEETQRFRELIDIVDAAPYPWPLQVMAEERGLFKATLPFEAGSERTAQLHKLRGRFRDWLALADG